MNYLTVLSLSAVAVAFIWFLFRKPTEKEAALRLIKAAAKAHGIKYSTPEDGFAKLASKAIKDFIQKEQQINLSKMDLPHHVAVANLAAILIVPFAVKARLDSKVLAKLVSRTIYGLSENKQFADETITPRELFTAAIRKTARECLEDPSTIDSAVNLSFEFFINPLEKLKRDKSPALQAVKCTYISMLAATPGASLSKEDLVLLSKLDYAGAWMNFSQ